MAKKQRGGKPARPETPGEAATPQEGGAQAARSAGGAGMLSPESPLLAALPAAVVFLVALAVYLRTLCPTIYPGDGAELTSAAWCLGVPHPTGYPLFMAVGWAFMRLGLGSPAFSMNILCALFAALGAAGAYWLALEVWRTVRGEESPGLPWRFASAGAALAVALGATWWSQGTYTEVYGLLMVFVSLAWALGLRVLRRPAAGGLYALAALAGLAFLHHQLFLVAMPLCALAAWRVVKATRGAGVATLLIALVCFAVPLLGYAYLPLRAAAEPRVNWGDPRGLRGIVWHLTGRQYAGTRVLARPTGQPMSDAEVARHLRRRLGEMAGWLGMQSVAPRDEADVRQGVLGLVWLALAALGLVALGRRSWLGAVGLAAGLGLNAVVCVVYTIADIEVYQLPMWLLVVVLASVAMASGAEGLFATDGPARQAARAHGARRSGVRAWVVGGTMLALAAWSVVNWHSPDRGVNKAEATQALDFARVVFEYLPERAVVLTSGDYDAFALWYGQICGDLRPDVAIAGANFVQQGWYAAMLRANLTGDLAMFLADEPPTTKRRWLTAVLGGMAAPALEAGRPVFTTAYEPEMASEWGFQVVPRLRPPPPWPTGLRAEMVLFELRADAQALANAKRRLAEMYPDWRDKMVRGRMAPAR